MTTTYEQERAKALAYVRRQCDEWRAEVGLPTRAQEQMREVGVRLAAATEGFRASMAQLASAFPPAAPDGFNNWEDEPAPIYDQLQRERGVA